MENYIYETHSMADPLLPFIFHNCHTKTCCQGPTNWHENIELLRCIEGSGYIQCGGEVFPFAKDDLFVVNADLLHSICSDTNVAYRCLIVDNSFCKSNGIPITSLSFQCHIQEPGVVALFDAAAKAFQNYDSRQPLAAATIRSTVLQLLLTLCLNYTMPKTNLGNSPASLRVKKAMAYIRSHMTQPISLEELANHVGISKFHLCREFKVFTGNTIVQATNLIRCTEAKRLIENGTPVGEAANFCGFENLSYFTKTFKKHFGRAPSAFVVKQG